MRHEPRGRRERLFSPAPTGSLSSFIPSARHRAAVLLVSGRFSRAMSANNAYQSINQSADQMCRAKVPSKTNQETWRRS